MVIVENGYLPPRSNETLRAMFEDRKRVFVDLLKWDVPVLEGRFEIDQFDDEHAAYVILTDASGMHLGSARLLRTDRSHILNSLFPALCIKESPAGEDVMEITRFCLSPRIGACGRRRNRARLVSALVRHALDNGIRTYTGVAEMAWLQQVLAFGWNCRPLGPPQRFGNSMLGALAIEIDSETPRRLAANGMWEMEGYATLSLSEAA